MTVDKGDTHDDDIRSVVDRTDVTLKRFDVPGARVIDGYTLPWAFEISKSSGGSVSLDEASKALRDISQRGIITKLLNEHGALLIRGSTESSPKAFSTLVHAAEEARGHSPFEQIGVAIGRTNFAKEVFSAPEEPPQLRITSTTR